MTIPGSRRESAFVTGAGSGIGAATARRLAARGAAVGLFDLSVDGLNVTADLIKRSGGEALCVPGDVRDEEAVAGAIGATADRFGGLDTAIACAGIEVMGTVIETSLDSWRAALDVNLTGVFLTARHSVPRLVESGRGTFTAVSSDAGIQGSQGYAAYTASKHGVIGLIRCLALDHGPEGVRSNAVCPNFVDTPMARRIFEVTPEAERDFYTSGVPLGRFAQPEEVANVIAHLTSADASYTNGLVYVLDGGVNAGYFRAISES